MRRTIIQKLVCSQRINNNRLVYQAAGRDTSLGELVKFRMKLDLNMTCIKGLN